MQVKYLKNIVLSFSTILLLACGAGEESRKNDASSESKSSKNQEKKKCSKCDGTGYKN